MEYLDWFPIWNFFVLATKYAAHISGGLGCVSFCGFLSQQCKFPLRGSDEKLQRESGRRRFSVSHFSLTLSMWDVALTARWGSDVYACGGVLLFIFGFGDKHSGVWLVGGGGSRRVQPVERRNIYAWVAGRPPHLGFETLSHKEIPHIVHAA
jgi:hypothetical protein